MTTTHRKERTFRSGPYLNKLFEDGGRVDAYLQREICARIKQARVAAGFIQEDMAALLSVTGRAYQNYERDRVPFRRLAEIAKLTGVQQEWLLRGDRRDEIPRIDLRAAVADALANLEESQEDVHRKLDETLARLETIEGLLSPPGAEQRTH